MKHEVLRTTDLVQSKLIGRGGIGKSVIALTCGLFVAQFVVGSAGTAAPVPSNQVSQEANIDTTTINYDSGPVSIGAYIAKPKVGRKHPAVIIVHDNQGLTDDFRGMAQELAAAGFVALLPDLLSRAGGTKSPEQSAAVIRQLAPIDTITDLKAGFAYLQKSPDVDSEKISAVGFGWGGWRTFMLASATPGLYRAVLYSGATPMEGLQSIRTPIMANYGQYDFFNVGNTVWTANTMTQLGKTYTFYIYPKAERGFFNSKSRQYDFDAAKTAWTRTLEFLKS